MQVFVTYISDARAGTAAIETSVYCLIMSDRQLILGDTISMEMSYCSPVCLTHECFFAVLLITSSPDDYYLHSNNRSSTRDFTFAVLRADIVDAQLNETR